MTEAAEHGVHGRDGAGENIVALSWRTEKTAGDDGAVAAMDRQARESGALQSAGPRPARPRTRQRCRRRRRPLQSSLLSYVETRVESRVDGDAEIVAGAAVRERKTRRERNERRRGNRRGEGRERKKSCVGSGCGEGVVGRSCRASCSACGGRVSRVPLPSAVIRVESNQCHKQWRRRRRNCK